MEKIKLLKNENKKLMNAMWEGEENLSEKLRHNKLEMEKMTQIINLIWPLINSHMKSEGLFD
jgi:hypothetical protein